MADHTQAPASASLRSTGAFWVIDYCVSTRKWLANTVWSALKHLRGGTVYVDKRSVNEAVDQLRYAREGDLIALISPPQDVIGAIVIAPAKRVVVEPTPEEISRYGVNVSTQELLNKIKTIGTLLIILVCLATLIASGSAQPELQTIVLAAIETIILLSLWVFARRKDL